MERRLTATDIVRMRRSLAMSPQLPADQVQWLLDEAERLVADHRRLEEITRQLTGPWQDIRAALNELYRLAGE